MRGPVNTRIKLTIVRMGQDKPIEITMTRELIRVPATVSRDTSIDADVSGCPDPSDTADMSKDPKFTEAVAHRVYYGPVYFRRESEPYITLSLAGTGRDASVSVAEVSLKLVWDLVRELKIGERGVGYVLDGQGRVIAHSEMVAYDPDSLSGIPRIAHVDIGLFQRDFSSLPQVEAARRIGTDAWLPPPARAMSGKDINGHDVLVAYTTIPPLGWLVFVEIPVEDADSLAR